MKTLRFIGMAIIAIIMGVNFAACSDDEEDEVIFTLSEEEQTLDFTNEGGERTISFKLNSGKWTSYYTDKPVNWVYQTPEEGKAGNNVITFKVLRNIGLSRSYRLTLSAYSDGPYPIESKTIIVNQEGIDNTLETYTIELEAGTLPGIISEDYMSLVHELTLKGDLNGTDILFLRKMLMKWHNYDGALAVLNLSDVNIVEGGGDYDEADNIRKFTSNDEIGEGMFSCTSNVTDVLESIILPNSVKVIGRSAFSGRRNLTTISIPDNVRTIDEYAFKSCTKLASLEIGSKVEKIGSYAFSSTNLKEIHVKTINPPTIADVTFDNTTYNATLYVPVGSIGAYKSAEHWNKFVDIIEE